MSGGKRNALVHYRGLVRSAIVVGVLVAGCAPAPLPPPDSASKCQPTDRDCQSVLEDIRALEALGLASEGLTTYAASEPANIDPTVRRAVRRQLALWWIQYFVEGGLVLLFAGWIAVRFYQWSIGRPVLRIESFEGAGGAEPFTGEFPAALRSEITKLAEAHGGAPADHMVTQPPQGATLPTDLGAALPRALNLWNVVPALVGHFLPRRGYTVDGVLHDAGTRGAGVTLRVSYRRRLAWSQTFWQDDYETGEPENTESGAGKDGDGDEQPVDTPPEREADSATYFSLAQYAATWLLFRIQDDRASARALSEDVRKWLGSKFKRLSGNAAGDPEELPTLLGTKRWEAYVQFQAGVNSQRNHKYGIARDHYVEALRSDREFLPAIYNLASIAERKFLRATLDSLRHCWQRKSDDNAAPKSGFGQATRYHAGVRYAVHLDTVLKDSRKTSIPEHDTRPVDIAEAVYQSIADARNELDAPASTEPMGIVAMLRHLGPKSRVESKRKARNDAEFARYLDYLLPIADSVRIGLKIRDGASRELVAELDRIRKKAVTPTTFYNLASAYSLAAAGTTDAAERATRLDNALEMVRATAFVSPPDAKELATDDDVKCVRDERSEEFWNLLDGVADPEPATGARFVLFDDNKGKPRFQLRTAEGEKLLLTTQSYASKGGARAGIESARVNVVRKDGIEHKQAANGNYYFLVKAKNGETVARSQYFTDVEERDAALAEIRRLVSDAPVEQVER